MLDSFAALEIEQKANPLRDRDDIYETFYEGTRKIKNPLVESDSSQGVVERGKRVLK